MKEYIVEDAKMKNRIINIIPVIGIFSKYIFFCTMSILNLVHTGSANLTGPSIYIIYSVVILLLNLIIYIHDVARNKMFKKNEFIILSIPVLIVLAYCFTFVKYGYIHRYTLDSLTYFLVWGCTGILSALNITRRNNIDEFINSLDYIILLFTIALFKSAIIPLISGGGFKTLGGETYQTASYIASLTFGLTLLLLYFKEDNARITNSKSKKLIFLGRVFSLLVSGLSVLVTGGRGGFVLLLCYLIYFLLIPANKKYIRKIKISAITIILMMVISLKNTSNSILITGWNRVTAFIDFEKGINWNGTSGRDVVYVDAINIIKKSAIIGYGGGGSYYEMNAYPHNFFLEVLIEGGVLYLVLFIILLITIFMKALKYGFIDNKYKIATILFVYTFVILMFSTSYMRLESFWFIIALIFTLQVHKKPKNQANK